MGVSIYSFDSVSRQYTERILVCRSFTVSTLNWVRQIEVRLKSDNR